MRFRAKGDGPKTLPFMGETMTCAVCGAVQKSDPAVMSNWRLIEIYPRRFYVCTEHFPADDAGEKAFEEAYYTVIKTILDKHGKDMPKR